MIEVNYISENNKEDFLKDTVRNTHSTDTEPEAELSSSLNLPQVCLSTNTEVQTKLYNDEVLKRKKKPKNIFECFADGLPSYEYDQHQIKKNQQEMKKKREHNKYSEMYDLNNNRFLNFFDAFLYIAKHCQKNNQRFTKDNCKQYLKQCYIVDFSHDGLIPISSRLPPKLFNKYFRFLQKELKYI